jgi:hypothetical protein
MPTTKYSVGLEFTKGHERSFTRFNAELALPLDVNGPNFQKLEARH